MDAWTYELKVENYISLGINARGTITVLVYYADLFSFQEYFSYSEVMHKTYMNLH